MSTIIIPLIYRQRPASQATTDNETLVDAALHFAQCLLWPEQDLEPVEREATLVHLRLFFDLAANRRKAFIALCERIILTQRYIGSVAGRYVPSPSVWFNPAYEHGFTGTRAWLSGVRQKRREVPGYLAHLAVVAEHYYRYITSPSATAFNDCRAKLLRLRAYGLLQYFYNTIVHYNYVRA